MGRMRPGRSELPDASAPIAGRFVLIRRRMLSCIAPASAKMAPRRAARLWLLDRIAGPYPETEADRIRERGKHRLQSRSLGGNRREP